MQWSETSSCILKKCAHCRYRRVVGAFSWLSRVRANLSNLELCKSEGEEKGDREREGDPIVFRPKPRRAVLGHDDGIASGPVLV